MNVVSELRFAVRMLARRPGFTLVVVLTLALGIGANTAIFSVVNAALLRPLAFNDPQRLVWIWGTVPKMSQASFSPVEFLACREQQASFEGLASYRNTALTVSEGDQPEQVQGVIASANYFSVLGVFPEHGRAFEPPDGEPGAPRVAVTSYSFWQRRYAGAPNLIGRSLTINGEAVTVIGIMPPGFGFNPRTELWLNPRTIVPDPQMNFRGDVRTVRENHYLRVFARLKPEVSIQQAETDLEGVFAGLERQYADQAGHGVRVVPLQDSIVGDASPILLVLLGAVGLVLLIACANITNLVLSRAAARYREIGIRAALGASRTALVRQLLIESVLLSLLGGAAGWLLAAWGVDLIVAVSPNQIPRWHEIRLDQQVLIFTLGVSLATGLIFGLAPALAAARTDLVSVLKESGRGATLGVARGRFQRLLVVGEVALAVVVLVGAGLLTGSFARLISVRPGFDPENLQTMWVALTSEGYGTFSANTRFMRELNASLEATPGVQGVAISNDLPIQGTDTSDYPDIEGRSNTPEDKTLVGHHVVNSHYFEAMGIRMVNGRAFTERDDANAPEVVIVNEAMANRAWPDQEPIGKRIRLGPPTEPWREVVGVVANVKHDGLHLPDSPHCYSPQLQIPWPYMAIAIRSEMDPASVLASVRQAVLKIDPNLPVFSPRTMAQLTGEVLATRRLVLVLFSLFGGVALVLAAIGLYGVILYSVTQRTQELGIRMALGASKRDVLSLIMRQGMMLVVIGVVAGIGAALALTRLMTGLLFNVSATDPATFAGVAALLISVALAACYVPARKATKVDPINALRYE